MVVDNITKEVIKNEYMDLKEAFNESRVKIERCTPTEGNLLLLKFTVKAKTHYITSVNKTNPIETDEIVFYINVPNGYPKSKPLVYYPKDKMLASVNAFTSGNQCIDDWHFDEHNAGNNSNLLVAARKTIMDIIHNPAVARFDSMANSALKDWQKAGINRGEFPTCRLDLLFKSEKSIAEGRAGIKPGLPVRPTKSVEAGPPLPKR